MRAESCFFRISGRKSRGASLLSLACAATFVFQGCGRGGASDGALDPNDIEAATIAANEAQNAGPSKAVSERLPSPQPPAIPSSELGPQLFSRHCAACHGERGDGKGLAAAFLFPKPRNLRASSLRLVSTDNNVPTREDLHAVLLRGMPGSAMPPWAHLAEQERAALVEEILRIRRDGLQESYVQRLKEE